DDRQAPADQGQDGVPAHQVPVPLVVGVHGHPGVGQHRLRPDGRDQDLATLLTRGGNPPLRLAPWETRVADTPLDRAADGGEGVAVLLPVNLQVRDRREVVGTPVADAQPPVEPALLPAAAERGTDGPDVARGPGAAACWELR